MAVSSRRLKVLCRAVPNSTKCTETATFLVSWWVETLLALYPSGCWIVQKKIPWCRSKYQVPRRTLDACMLITTIHSSIKSALGTTNKEEFTLDSFDTGSQSQASSSMKGTECTISVSWMGGGQVKDGEHVSSLECFTSSLIHLQRWHSGI